MSDDIWKGFDALLWLRSKQGQYAGYPAESQDGIRHQYFKAAADELERLQSKLHEREKLLREIDAFMSFRPTVPTEETKKIQRSIREALGDDVQP